MSCSRIQKWLSYVTVEPVMFFTFFGFITYQLIRDTGIYRTVCIREYGQIPGINCTNLSGHPDIENAVQKKSTMWLMSYGIAILLPAMATDILLGAWGDRRGRKSNMLLGITGTVVAVLPLIFLLTYSNMPIYALLFANLICGFTGSPAIVMVSSYAYLADHITDHNLLTVRMAILSLFLSLSLITGSYLGGLLLQYITMVQTACMVIGSLSLGFFYCVLRLKDVPPPHRKKSVVHAISDQEEPRETDSLLGRCADTSPCRRCCSEVILTFGYAKQLLKEVWHTFTQKRPRNHRAYMLIGVICFHVATLADFQGNVVTLFVYRRPLSWTPSELATWKAVNGSANLLGGLIGAIILKRLLKVNDTTLILLGMICAASQNVALGLSTQTWSVYLSSVLGLFSTIVQPTICSLTTRLVRRDEVGKAFAAFALAAETALILSTVLLNAIYQASVALYPGIVFFFVAGCVLVMFLPMVWVHVNYDEEGEDLRKKRRDETGKDDEDEEEVENEREDERPEIN